MLKKIKCFNVFSGVICNLLEEDLRNIGLGYIPLLKDPRSNCKKCHGRFYIAFSTENLTHVPCSCVHKNINLDILKEIENKHLKLSEELSKSRQAS